MASGIRGVSLLWVSSILGSGSTFLLYMVLARSLTVDEFGAFGAAYTVSMLLVIVAAFGVPQALIKIFGKHGKEGVLWVNNAFFLLAITIVTAGLILFLWALLGSHDVAVKDAFAWLSLFIVGQVGVELCMAKLQLEERYFCIALWQFVPNFARLLLVVVLVFAFAEKINIVVIAMVYALIGVLCSAVALFMMTSLVKGEIELVGHESLLSYESYKDPQVYRGFVAFYAEAWPFFLAALFAFVYLQIDIVMLKYMSGDEEAGLYNVAFVIINSAIILPSVLYGRFFFSKYQRWVYSDIGKLRSAYLSGNKFMLMLGVLGAVFVVFLSWWFVPFFFGEKYTRSVSVLNLLAISLPIYFVAYSAGAVLTTGRQIRKKVALMGVTALINLGLNFALIPLLGMIGAAISTIASNIVLLILYLNAANRLFQKI